MRDVVSAILAGLADGDVEAACRHAARWCSLNSEHRAACNDNNGAWEILVRVVFPGAQWPPPNDGTTAKAWFFHLCDQHQHARLVGEAEVAQNDYEKMRRRANRAWALAERRKDLLAEWRRQDWKRWQEGLGDENPELAAKIAKLHAEDPREEQVTALMLRAERLLKRAVRLIPGARNMETFRQTAGALGSLMQFRLVGRSLRSHPDWYVRLVRELERNMHWVEDDLTKAGVGLEDGDEDVTVEDLFGPDGEEDEATN